MASVLHDWQMWSRASDYSPSVELPVGSAQMVLRHMGVDTAVVTTPYSAAAYESLEPGNGVVLFRDGRQEFSGRVDELEMTWDAQNGRTVVKASCVGDEVLLADRLSFPDPLRAADNQTVNNYWTYTGVASSAMMQLISDQAGPTAKSDRRITGIVLGANPGVGLSRTWSALFTPVLDELALMSVVSGFDLGLKTTTAAGSVTFDIVQPRALQDSVRFAADLGNLAGFSFRTAAPKLTIALAAGGGDLNARVRKQVDTADPLAYEYDRQIWSYIDRRDTTDVAELTKAAEDALAEGGPSVNLSVTLLDSQAATYGVDWWLGDRITVYVGLPGQTNVSTVSDVVREIFIEVADSGAETIRPAIGSFDAKAVVPTPTQQQLARVRYSLAGLIANK